MWSNWAPSPSLLDVGDSLDDAVALAISNAYASSTLATRKSQALRYLRFCRLLQTSPFPISVRTLCRYCVYLSRTLKYSSIANYLHGLRWLHVMFDYPPPPISHCRVQLTVRGLKRLLSASVKRKLPITPTILLALRDVMDLSLPLHLALWAAFLLGFFSFFRKSNIIPPSHSQFSPNKHLSRSDFYFTSWGLIVSVKWSKVNQFRERTLLIPLVSIPSHALCPVQALRKFFDMCPAPASSPPFVIPTAHGLRSLSYSSFTKHLKDLLGLAGFTPDDYSGHSFRRGGATYASSLGIFHELIQLQGDWASTAYLEYLARPLRQRYTLAAQVATQIASSPSFPDPDGLPL